MACTSLPEIRILGAHEDPLLIGMSAALCGRRGDSFDRTANKPAATSDQNY